MTLPGSRSASTARSEDLTDTTLAEDGAQEVAAAFELVRVVALGIDDAASIDDALRFALGEVCA